MNFFLQSLNDKNAILAYNGLLKQENSLWPILGPVRN